MNPFEPANLSPLPKAPLACALPYDLTWDDLRPILPDFDERGSAGAQAFASHEKQGLHGGSNSCILTIRYPAGENQFRSETIFIKHTADPKNAEAQKYRFVASHGIPTPRLLAVIRRGGAEIILLEFLPAIGIDFRSTGEVNSMLHLVAQLNSIQNPPDLFKPPPRDPRPESHAAFDEGIRVALTEISRDPTLPIAVNVQRWFDAYRIAQQASDSMPLAVNHNEFYFQQVGWAQRGATRQLVIFDLETMSLCPRFTDLASVLYPLAAYTGRDQVELFGVYLDRLCQLNQPELGSDEAFRELRLLRVTTSCWSLPWLVDEAGRPDVTGLGGVLVMTATCLRDDLIALELLR
jgi:hypothetical protein